MRRTGIDLSSIRCNVVDAEARSRRSKSEPATCRVHGFASITHLDNVQALTAELKALLSRRAVSRQAWVNLWDVRSSHQYLLLPSAPASELESRARHHGAMALGMHDYDVTVATTLGGARGEPGHHPKREVSFFAAGSAEIRTRLRPIVDAGFIVEGVTTPCGALWSQARLRRASLPGEVHAHVVIGVSQSALGIFSDGSLLYARDLDWGFAASPVGTPIAPDRHVLADRLSAELRRSFLYLKQYWEPEVSQVLLCGDMPEIRSLTALLIERLNIEVDALDTLESFDTATLPDGFADRASTLRLASSIAVEPPPVNLLPVEARATRTDTPGRRIVAVGAAAAVAAGAILYAHANAIRIDAEQRLAAIRRDMSSLQTPMVAAQSAGVGRERDSAERTALRALDTQGPAMARVLETIANAAPHGVTLRVFQATPAGGDWTVRVDAIASGRDLAEARQAGDQFLRALAGSSLLDEPLREPTRRYVPDLGGMEISAAYRVRK